MMKIDSQKMMMLALLGFGAYWFTSRKATAGTVQRPTGTTTGYTGARPPSSASSTPNINAGALGGILGGLFNGFNGQRTVVQPGYTVGPSTNSRSSRDAADANDIFMPGYGTGSSTNSRSSRDAQDYIAYDNTDSVATNPAGQYTETVNDGSIFNDGWGEG